MTSAERAARTLAGALGVQRAVQGDGVVSAGQEAPQTAEEIRAARAERAALIAEMRRDLERAQQRLARMPRGVEHPTRPYHEAP
jgi:hypothetical protein